MTVILTDEEADRIEATARDKGRSPDDVLRDAVSAYLRNFPRRDSEPPKPLGFIGIGASGVRRTSEDMERVLREEFAQHVLEESFSDSSETSADGEERPDLWFIGLLSDDDPPPYAPDEDPGVRRRIAQAIWEDSFGGTRPWTDPDEPSAAGDAMGENVDPTR